MSSSLRKMLLLLLGIPFVILGTRFMLDAGESLFIHTASADWRPGNATIVSVDQFTSADQALGSQTVVRYAYDFAGQGHEGQFTCIGDECPQPDLLSTLRAAQNENRAVAVLVDPADPGKSLLYRHLYMPLFLLRAGVGLFCFLTGSAAVIFGVYLLRGPGAVREGA